ncbi:hypothetical protein [Variovorax sp. efr-133-TYG-130]|nr:hypothetical protein [Variovorax sp. efr-133-TYG-130]
MTTELNETHDTEDMNALMAFEPQKRAALRCPSTWPMPSATLIKASS